MPANATLGQKKRDSFRVLVVDDECGPRESLRVILTPTYDVTIAKDGCEALEKFTSDAPDMVISDIRMPRMDGIQLLQEVKRQSPETPFILLTGFGTLESAQQAVRTGAYDYISKPYNVDDIRDVVAKAFEETCKKRDMARALDRLQATNSHLEQSIQELDQKASIGELWAEMIHDLNNPICALQGYVELLECALSEQNGFAGSDQEEFLDVIRQQADRCIMLTQRFLNYARPSRETWTFEDINTLLENIFFLFKIRCRSRGIRTSEDLASALPRTWVQSTQLQQVFYNLIMNAVHALEELPEGEGLLTIGTRLAVRDLGDGETPVVEIVVRDNGPGISPASREDVFEAFYTTKPQGQGTGLGLAICKRVTGQHGGRLELHSEEGEGACFTVSIPIREEPPEEEDLEPSGI